jgi:hypothetical protein
VIVDPSTEQLGEPGRRVRAVVQDTVDLVSVHVSGAVQLSKGSDQIAQWVLARQHLARSPAQAAADVPLCEPGKHPRADQRTLAAARIPMDHDQLLVNEPADHLLGHRLPPEEDRPFIALERTKARIGTGRQRRVERVQFGVEGGRHHATFSAPRLAPTSHLRI